MTIFDDKKIKKNNRNRKFLELTSETLAIFKN